MTDEKWPLPEAVERLARELWGLGIWDLPRARAALLAAFPVGVNISAVDYAELIAKAERRGAAKALRDAAGSMGYWGIVDQSWLMTRADVIEEGQAE